MRSPWLLRSNNVTESSFSSALICFITAVGVTKSASAALVKLPHSATLTNVSNRPSNISASVFT